MVTLGHFLHRKTGVKIFGLCTQFDEKSEKSRTESAKLILEFVKNNRELEAKNATSPAVFRFFVAGDISSWPEQDPYNIVTRNSSMMMDTRDHPSQKFHYGNYQTTIDTAPGASREMKDTVDFVFVGPKDNKTWEVPGHSVMGNYWDSQAHSSDHRAVVVDLLLSH